MTLAVPWGEGFKTRRGARPRARGIRATRGGRRCRAADVSPRLAALLGALLIAARPAADAAIGDGGGPSRCADPTIGTAPEQQGENGAPDAAKDRSNRNWIHGNDFVTKGNAL